MHFVCVEDLAGCGKQFNYSVRVHPSKVSVKRPTMCPNVLLNIYCDKI